jgi:hypothetical protein
VKIDKVYIVYGLIVLFLLVGIFALWPRNKISFNKIQDISQIDGPVVEIAEGDKRETAKNINGTVLNWNGESDVLSTNVDGKKFDFQIDPEFTLVTVTRADNKGKEFKMNEVRKSINPKEWQTAFCMGDKVVLLLDLETTKVKWIMNTGARVCGYKWR